MSKLNSRFSHLRINTGNDEYRKVDNSSKTKQKQINEINTFRIQSPKNIDMMFNKPLKISLTSPLTTKNENNNNKLLFGVNSQDSTNKAVKPSILTVFKNYSKGKNNENNLQSNNTLGNFGSFNNAVQNNPNLVNINLHQNANLNNQNNNYLKTQINKESDKTAIHNSNSINKNIRKNLNNGNINTIYSNRENLIGNITNKYGKPLLNSIANNHNTERNFKSESPNVRKENFNTTRRLPDFNNNDYQDKVLHTENILHEKNRNPQFIDIMELMNSNQVPISLSLLTKHIPNFEKSKHSSKSMKYVKGYSANTHQGTVRNYNEDRVSIILNVVKPNSFNGDYWPKCSIFGIYDGHGGVVCADFLRDHLHQYVIRNPNFPNNPREAILRGFENAERDFINNYALDKSGEVIDRSGSCAIMIFIIDDICYVANVGDSRAIMSVNNGKNIETLSHDHKPGLKEEEKRILQAGGKVYQTQTPTNSMNLSILQKSFNIDINSISSNQVILGPSRVFPGRLSVSRSFGDIEAKLIKNGGNPNVVIATPEITCFKLTSEMDYIVLGCDGIFDQLSNKDIIDSIWLTTREDIRANDVHSQCSLANDLIIKSCINRKCLDNITCVIIAFENFERLFESEILHTYDGNIPNNKPIESNRVMTEINFDNIEKYRSYSNRNPNAPISTKNSRPKLPFLEDMSNREHLSNVNTNNLNVNPNAMNEIKFKNYTPLTTKGFKDRIYSLEYMKKNPFSSNHELDKDRKADEVSKNRQLDKIVENNSNFAKTKQYMIEAEKENPALNGQMNNTNHNNTMKIPRKGSFKLGNSIKLNFDYKKQAKDNMPITLMHINKK